MFYCFPRDILFFFFLLKQLIYSVYCFRFWRLGDFQIVTIFKKQKDGVNQFLTLKSFKMYTLEDHDHETTHLLFVAKISNLT